MLEIEYRIKLTNDTHLGKSAIKLTFGDKLGQTQLTDVLSSSIMDAYLKSVLDVKNFDTKLIFAITGVSLNDNLKSFHDTTNSKVNVFKRIVEKIKASDEYKQMEHSIISAEVITKDCCNIDAVIAFTSAYEFSNQFLNMATSEFLSSLNREVVELWVQGSINESFNYLAGLKSVCKVPNPGRADLTINVDYFKNYLSISRNQNAVLLFLNSPGREHILSAMIRNNSRPMIAFVVDYFVELIVGYTNGTLETDEFLFVRHYLL